MQQDGQQGRKKLYPRTVNNGNDVRKGGWGTQNRKVVIIDEDDKSLSATEEILLMGGYDPVVVNDASLAVDTVIQKKPNAILVELIMPRKNGFELVDRIN